MGNFFKINDIKLYSSKVKKDIKISLIADLHFSHLISATKLEKIKEKIYSFEPDYICMAGDILDCVNILEGKEYLKQIKKWLIDISLKPTIISLGNHDFFIQVPKQNKNHGWDWSYHYPKEFIDEMNSSSDNLNILKNEVYKDNNIIISGYTQPYQDCYYDSKENEKILNTYLEEQKKLTNINSNLPMIAMVHDPSYLPQPEIASYFCHYDFIFSGHMHNGVVPPILDEIWKSNVGIIQPNKKLVAPNARGIIPIVVNEKTIFLIVTGGIVKISEAAPNILHPCDIFFPMSIENITITNHEDVKQYTIKSKYRR